jgi:hypothetical protein
VAACKARYGFDEVTEYCLQADVSRAPTVALVGDSHAYHLNAGLMKHYSTLGENFVMFATRFPFWGLDPRGDDYQRVTDPALDIVLNTPTIHTVIISMHWWLTRIPMDHDRINKAADETLRRFIAAGKHVIYVNVTPRMDFEPRSCIPRVAVPSSVTRTPCAVPRTQVERQTAEHNAILGELLKKHPQVELFDPMPYLCDSQLCWAMKDGRLLYRDMTHLTYSGDLYIGEKFSEEQRRRHPQQQ